jgi:putative alpha-1,2-mannosidase
MLKHTIIAWLACTVCCLSAAHADSFGSVDPLIGTAGTGHLFPGAVVPFGMVQLSPDTWTRYFKESYPWAGGYQYGDPTIPGFSHTHFSGAGHSDLGDGHCGPPVFAVTLFPLAPR